MPDAVSTIASQPASRVWRAVAIGLTAAGVGTLALEMAPRLRIDLFAAAAARLAGAILGAAVERDAAAFLLLLPERSVAVTAACSGTDFFLMVAALIGWRRSRPNRSFGIGVLSSLALAVPVAIGVNALRIVAVTQAHRWVIPMLPERHAAFAHMATGVAIFLPSLIALNFGLELHARHHASTAR